MINTKNLIMRKADAWWSNWFLDKKDKPKEAPKAKPDLAPEKADLNTAKTVVEVTALKWSVERQAKGFDSSYEYMQWTALEDKLALSQVLWSKEKAKEFVDRIDKLWYGAAKNMIPWMSEQTLKAMTVGINASFIESLDGSVTIKSKDWNEKVQNIFESLLKFDIGKLDFDGIATWVGKLFGNASMLYTLSKNTTKIARIIRTYKKEIGDWSSMTVLNNPEQFKDLLNDQELLKLTDEEITTKKDVILAKLWSTQLAKNHKNIKDIYDSHGKSLTPETLKKVTQWLSHLADVWDKVLPVMDNISTWIDTKWADYLRKFDGIFTQLGIAWWVKEFLNTILWFFGRDYDSVLHADDEVVAEKTDYKWSSFSKEWFLALANIYESMPNLEWWCLKEVRKFMQALHKEKYIDLPADIDKETRGGEAKEFGTRLKTYANWQLPKDWSDKWIYTADLSDKSDNATNIYNTIAPMKWDMFNIVMKKTVNDGWSWAGHIAFGARVGNEIYIYDNSIKWTGDLNFVPSKNWFTLEKYISLMKGKYNFDAVMSIQGKYYKENNTEVVAETSESRKKYIFDYFKWKFDEDTAAAFVGNIAQETGKTFDPKTLQASWWPGCGICQWEKNGRFADLENFAKSKWTAWDNLQTQLDFIVYELNGKEKDAAAKIKSASWVDAKTDAIGKYYERAWSLDLVARRESANDAKKSLA